MIILNDRNIESGLKRIFRQELEEIGYEVPEDISYHDLVYEYFVMHKRLIPTKKRKVCFSRDFICPEKLRTALKTLVNEIEAGQNINPYLSRTMKDVEYKDKLLFDWNVYHLHLGETKDKDGYIRRTGALLFAMFDDENAYFINVYDHKDHWTDKDILNSLNETWPEIMNRHKINAEPECDFSSEELKHLRDANVNTIVKLRDGSSIYAPGLGLMTSGHSMAVMTQVTNLAHDIIGLRRYILQWVMQHPELNGYEEIGVRRHGDDIVFVLTGHRQVVGSITIPPLAKVVGGGRGQS